MRISDWSSDVCSSDLPDQVIKSTTTAIQADITKNVSQYQANKASFYKMVDTQIVPHFDTTYIAKVILGTHLKEATHAQVAQFEAAFKDMPVHRSAEHTSELPSLMRTSYDAFR